MHQHVIDCLAVSSSSRRCRRTRSAAGGHQHATSNNKAMPVGSPLPVCDPVRGVVSACSSFVTLGSAQFTALLSLIMPCKMISDTPRHRLILICRRAVVLHLMFVFSTKHGTRPKINRKFFLIETIEVEREHHHHHHHHHHNSYTFVT